MSPMAQLYVRNAKKVECASAFPPTAISVTVRISKIVPKDLKCIRKLFSAVVISSWIF
jgi:hypothetical protein